MTDTTQMERFEPGMTGEELIERLRQIKAMPDYRHPASDLGYCTCGTVWNIEAFAERNYKRGMCPDCGEDAAAVERASPSPIEERSDTDPSTRPD